MYFVEKQAGAAHVKRLDFSDHSSFKPKVHFKFSRELLLSQIHLSNCSI